MIRALVCRTILDRYVLLELAGPFGFGLSAFTLIFAATQILALGRLVSNDHAPLGAAIAIFIWQIPGMVVLVIPMALLLGTLLAIQRLSADSEITAMKAGGISFVRIVSALLIAGLVVSFVDYIVQENVVPFAASQVTAIEDSAITHTSAFNQDLTVSAPLPGGGRQVTIATGYEPHSQALLNVTLVQYDASNTPVQIIFAKRADFQANSWLLNDVSAYRFDANGVTLSEPHVAQQEIAIGEQPADIVERLTHNDPDAMSRRQIAALIRTGQLTGNGLRKYLVAFHEKLARPFACFVFVLMAIPFGIRALRGGGGGASLGFGLAVAIAFIYYVVLTIFSYLAQNFIAIAPLLVWMPNAIFTAIGLRRLLRMAAV